MPSSVEWGNTKTVKVDFTQTGETTPNIVDLKYVWRDNSTGLATSEANQVTAASMDIALPSDSSYVGKSYSLYMDLL